MTTGWENAPLLRCLARWLDDEPQPGLVVFEFRDADGVAVRMIAKDVWTPDVVIPRSGEPVEVWVPVVVLEPASADRPQPVVKLPDGDEISLVASVGDLRFPA